MAGNLNKVMLIGYVGADPTTRAFQNGSKVVNLRMATTERWRDKTSGEKQEKSEWHNVSIFNEALAKVAEQYVKKGSLIYIEGKLETRKWTDQGGVERYTTEIALRQFNGVLTLLDRSDTAQGDHAVDDRDAGRSGSYDDRSGGGRSSGQGQGGGARADMDDEIPF